MTPFTAYVMQSQQDWLGGPGWGGSAPVIYGPEEERYLEDVRAIGYRRIERRTYWLIKLENGDKRGVKVSYLPREVARLFKRVHAQKWRDREAVWHDVEVSP